MDPSPTLTLSLPSRMEFLPIVRSFIEAVCDVGKLDEATRQAIILAANEATSNVIRHAHQCQPEQSVQVECLLLGDGIEVRLHDQGEPFDVEDVPQLDPTEIRPGGRGVFLMRSLLDELTCTPRPEGGNTLRMVKRSPTVPPPSTQS